MGLNTSLTNMVDDINVQLGRRGLNRIKQNHHQKIQQWMSYYRGNVDKFHKYSKKVSGRYKTYRRRTMNIAKTIATDKASLMFGEGFTVNVENNQEVLDTFLKDNNVNNYLPIFYEKILGYAGYGFIIEFLNDGKTELDFITGETSYVVGEQNNIITDILTLSQDIIGSGKNRVYYNLLTFHTFHDNIYTVEHQLYQSTGGYGLGSRVPLKSFPKYEDLEEKKSYETPVPHFQIIQARVANHHDVDVAYSAPVTAHIIDTYEALDILYHQMTREYELKQPRVAITSDALQTDIKDTGALVQYFDEDDDLYQVVAGTSDELIKEINTGDFRTQDYVDGINMNLKIVSKQAGLGNDFYSFDPKKGLMTATQVISDKSELFRNKKNDEKIVEEALTNMIISYGNINGLDFGEINIMFDDSIITDDEKEKEDDLTLVDLGMMSKARYLVEHKGLTYNEALRWLNEVQVEIAVEQRRTEELGTEEVVQELNE